jgi:hypothetical protein
MLQHFTLSTGLLLALSAGATEIVIDSNSPYWEVGPRDQTLSRACAIGKFNQRQIGRYVIRLHARQGGAAVLGIAKGTGLNLRDPDHLAQSIEDYFFRDDGTSSCEVFVGGRTPVPSKPVP